MTTTENGTATTGDQRAPSLLKVASDVAAVMRAMLDLSDSVKAGVSPLDSQGRLLHLQNSIQKNRTRIVQHVNRLCDLIDAEKAGRGSPVANSPSNEKAIVS